MDLEADWDVIVIDGGITGAGIFNLASRRGLKTLLLEQQDFAWAIEPFFQIGSRWPATLERRHARSPRRIPGTGQILFFNLGQCFHQRLA